MMMVSLLAIGQETTKMVLHLLRGIPQMIFWTSTGRLNHLSCMDNAGYSLRSPPQVHFLTQLIAFQLVNQLV